MPTLLCDTHRPPPETPLRPHGGWLLLAAALVLLGAVVHEPQFNLPLLRLAQQHRMLPDAVWAGLTLLGFGWAGIIIVLAADRGDGRASALLLRSLPIGTLLTHVPKNIFQVPRPMAALPGGGLQPIGEPVVGGGSMPSGHALAAFATVMVLYFAYFALARARRRPWLATAALLVAAAGVAWSRVAVLAHWPADVLAGAGLGIATAWLAQWFELHWPWAAKVASRRGQMTLAGIECVAAVAWFFADTGHPTLWPLQWALSALALASAWWRWRRLNSNFRHL